MDSHKIKWDAKPIVIDKPLRGRQLTTTEVPRGLLDTMRTGTAKQQLREDQKLQETLVSKTEGGVETYHEGWVDGRKYLVPDSNLEVMKDLVNMRLRRRGDVAFTGTKQAASKQETLEQYGRRFREMSRKIDQLEEEKKSVYKKERAQAEETNNEGAPAEKSKVGTLDRRRVFELIPMSEKTRTFLISGHIREDAEPLFVIQKYVGKSPFGRSRVNFSQVESSEDVDILISGNFYKHSILEGKLKLEGLSLKWDLVVPIDDRSKLYDRRFSETFDIEGVSIKMEGDFIKKDGSTNYTPILTFQVPTPSLLKGRRYGKLSEKPIKIIKPIGDMLKKKNIVAYNLETKNELNGKITTGGFATEGNVCNVPNDEDTVENMSTKKTIFEEKTEEVKERGCYFFHEFNGDIENNEGSKQYNKEISKSKRRVVGSSSATDQAKTPNVSVCFEIQPEVDEHIRNQQDLKESPLKETTVVSIAPKGKICNPFENAEPNLTSNSGCRSDQEKIYQEMIFENKNSCTSHEEEASGDFVLDKRRGDQGDAGNDTCEAEYKNDSRSRLEKGRDVLHAIRKMKPKSVQPPENELKQKASPENTRNCRNKPKKTHSCCEILVYKCQVRPSKKKSKRNTIFQHISKLFPK